MTSETAVFDPSPHGDLRDRPGPHRGRLRGPAPGRDEGPWPLYRGRGHLHGGREPRGVQRGGQVQAASIHTNQTMRDDHLRTNDFLDVPNYPTLSLTSTGLSQVDDTHWVMTGDLTIRGVTKPVDFDLEYLGEGPSMQEGKTVVAFEARGDRPARLRRQLQPLAARRQRRGRQQGRDRARGRGLTGRLTRSADQSAGRWSVAERPGGTRLPGKRRSGAPLGTLPRHARVATDRVAIDRPGGGRLDVRPGGRPGNRRPQGGASVGDRAYRRARLSGRGDRIHRGRRRRAVAAGVVGCGRGVGPTGAGRERCPARAGRRGRLHLAVVGTVPVDGAGEAIGPAIIWMDSRGAHAVREKVRGALNIQGYSASKLARWVRKTGGIPSLSGKDPVGHIHFLRDHRPDVYGAAAVFLEPVDYLEPSPHRVRPGLARLHHGALGHRQPGHRRRSRTTTA